MTVSAPTASTVQRQRHAHNNQGAALTRSKPSLDELLLRLTGMPGGKLNAVVSHARWWLPSADAALRWFVEPPYVTAYLVWVRPPASGPIPDTR